ncbi:MAG: oligosaccharide flippase family protein [Candidatus Doudnabacteria bacterium]|nr:oligosaccharide flippase family protein [Candidatus Doudnabacteria bacterium]
METNSTSYKLLKNLSYSLIGFTWPIIFSLLITPVVVKRLGTEDYGIYLLIGTITAFLALLDLGLTAAMVKFVSENYTKGESEENQKLFNFANTNYLVIGVVGLLVYGVLGIFFLNIFHIDGYAVRNIMPVFILSGLIFFVSSVNSVFVLIPQALQRYDIITKLNMFQLTASSLVMLVLVLQGFQLKAIFLSNLIIYIIVSLLYRRFAKRLMPDFKLGFSLEKKFFSKVYGFGIYAALANITNNALQQFDRLFIPAFLGPAQLSYYGIAGSVSSKTALVVGSLSNVFFPMSSSLIAEGKAEMLGDIYRRIIRNLAVFASAITLSILLFSDKILLFWLNKDFADKSNSSLVVLAFTYFILALYGTLYHFILGLGQVKFLAKWSTCLAALNVVLLFILVPKYGILGAAWAYFLATLPLLFMFYWVEKKFLKLSGIFRFYLKLFAKIISTGLAFFLFGMYGIIPLVNGLISLVILGPLSILIYLLIYKLFGFYNTEDEELIRSFIKKILVKFNLAHE